MMRNYKRPSRGKSGAAVGFALRGPVLPRPGDAVQDAREVFEDRTPRLRTSPAATDLGDLGDDSWGSEQVTGDFGDAYVQVESRSRIDTYWPKKLRNKYAGARWADFACSGCCASGALRPH